MRPFEHFNAGTVGEAILAAQGNSRIIAGGTDCLSMVKNRLLPAYPEVLVNIKTIPGLGNIQEDAEGLKIGALTTLANLEDSPTVKEKYGILADAARSIGSPQVRNMATIGGNLCQDVRCWYYRRSPLTGRGYFCYRKGGPVCFAVGGDNRYHAILGGKLCFAVCPSDTAIALTALEADIIVQGKAGDRKIPVKDFFVTMGNVLTPGEIVKEIRVPKPPKEGKQTFLKFRLRKAIDFAIVSVASVIAIEGGVCQDARIVLGAVAPMPIRARNAEEAIMGKTIDTAMAEAAAMTAVAGAKPLTMNAYKIEITKALVKRAILAHRKPAE
ncbi:MAG: xanthine dehydrogenase family protein subunit M [Chloroflexi bacterium]|nr:xanthine dehydrogenase family protein subunit M [Chloroflexota bacterium]